MPNVAKEKKEKTGAGHWPNNTWMNPPFGKKKKGKGGSDLRHTTHSGNLSGGGNNIIIARLNIFAHNLASQRGSPRSRTGRLVWRLMRKRT